MNGVEILKRLFLSQIENCTFGRGDEELNGLKSNSVPENCEILDRFTSNSKDRIFYLLQLEDAICLIRVCTAMKDSGYDEFAVLHAYGTDEVAEQIKDRFYRWKDCM